MSALLDVNILIALVDAKHTHHQKASNWFRNNRRLGWTTCPITQNGCLRILSQPRYSNYMGIAEAMQRLSDLTDAIDHHFIADDISLLTPGRIDISALSSHRQLTDIYLLALAVGHDMRFVTLDRGMQLAAVSGASENHLVVI